MPCRVHVWSRAFSDKKLESIICQFNIKKLHECSKYKILYNSIFDNCLAFKCAPWQRQFHSKEKRKRTCISHGVIYVSNENCVRGFGGCVVYYVQTNQIHGNTDFFHAWQKAATDLHFSTCINLKSDFFLKKKALGIGEKLYFNVAMTKSLSKPHLQWRSWHQFQDILNNWLFQPPLSWISIR